MKKVHDGQDFMSFGQEVRRLRREKDISQRDLAALIGVDFFTYLSKIENGRMDPPSEAVIWRIATVLETDGWKLLNHAGKVPKAIKSVLEDNPLAVELLRLLSERKLSDETYCKMIALAHDEKSS